MAFSGGHTMLFSLRLCFDGEGDPPSVELVGPDGMVYAEIYEEPKLKDGRAWSRHRHDWMIGPLAQVMIDLLNEKLLGQIQKIDEIARMSQAYWSNADT